jgi:hypothetical protein
MRLGAPTGLEFSNAGWNADNVLWKKEDPYYVVLGQMLGKLREEG